MKFHIKCTQKCVRKSLQDGYMSEKLFGYFGSSFNKMLPLELEQLIMEYERAIILRPHPTAIIMRGYYQLGVFGSCVFGVYSICPYCRITPLLL